MTDTDDRNSAHAAPYETHGDYDAVVAELRDAAAAYYDSGELLMDDATYDRLVARVAATVAEHPDWDTGLSTAVAGGSSAGGDVTHTRPMLSLDNVFDADELRGWYQKLCDNAGGDVAVRIEPKLDGLAISARYENGHLTVAATRGDGRTGEDVTDRVPDIDGLPDELGCDLTWEIRGEVYMTDDDFDVANEARTAAGSSPYANPRNAAAGALRRRSGGTPTPLTFAAYDVDGHDGDWSDALDTLRDVGVRSSAALIDAQPVRGADAVIAAVEAIAERRATLGYGIDGAVIKADSADVRAAVGTTSRAPRWAIAYKYPADTALTRLTGIALDVGRTGVITPRAELEPVSVGGTTITSATLHHPGEVARLDIRVGDKVWVLRAGDVIPRITGPNVTVREEGLEPWTPPQTCPRCGSDIDRSEARWRCVRGRNCNTAAVLRWWCSRDCLDIEGAGEAVIAALVDRGLVTTPADLYHLDVTTLTTLDRVGERSATKLLAEIEASKSQPLSRVFCGLGLRRTGRTMSRRLAAAFGTMDALRRATVAELAAVEGIGAVRAEAIAEGIASVSDVIDALADAGVNMVEPQAAGSAGGDGEGTLPFAGLTVVVSGTVPGLSRNEANEWVERLGGKSSGSVSGRTGLLVAGDGAGSKVAKAEKLGVTVMDAGEFAGLVAAQQT